MNDDVLGPLERGDHDGMCGWTTTRAIPFLAKFGVIEEESPDEPLDPAEQQAAMLSEMQETLEFLQEKMTGLVGEELAQKLISELQSPIEPDEVEEDPDEAAAEAEYRAHRQREVELFRAGQFLIRIEDDAATGPSPEQKASIKQFFANEKTLLRDIMKAIKENYQEGYRDQPEWFAGLPRIKRIEELEPMIRCAGINVLKFHYQGFAYINLIFECEWNPEEGLGVQWHPLQGLMIGTAREVFDVEEADNLDEEAALSIHQQLCDAVLENDETRIQELVAQGANLNGFDPKSDSAPLCIAVESMDVGMVQRMLTMGADPTLRGYDRMTPMKKAREIFQTVDVESAKGMNRTLVEINRVANPEEFEKTRSSIMQIMDLLREAGAN